MAPKEVIDLFYSYFKYPGILIAQVATCSLTGSDIRSMGLFEVDKLGRLVFLTNRLSHKWKQLMENPSISILLLNGQQTVQIISRGTVDLISMDSHPTLIKEYWETTPSQAKQTFRHKEPEGRFSPIDHYVAIKEIPESFGLIQMLPDNWETLVIDPDNYVSSCRYYYEKKANAWEKRRLNAI